MVHQDAFRACDLRRPAVLSYITTDCAGTDVSSSRHHLQNYPLLAAICLQFYAASNVCRMYVRQEEQATPVPAPIALLVMLEWMGRCGYFALGNSNSIATIDVSKAFTGLSEYNQTVSSQGPSPPPHESLQICGIFTAMITFTGPLLMWFATLAILAQLFGSRRRMSCAVLLAASLHSSMR